MNIKKTFIKDLYILTQSKKLDNRGFFSRVYCSKLLNKRFKTVRQINKSFSKNKFTLRGLHFQTHPLAEDKIVICIKGSIYDVAVDLRKKSKTYGKWKSIILSENNNKMFLIPKGFAHGFLTLKNNTEVLYLVSQYYNKESERGYIYNDPYFSIKWPYKPKVISTKDKSLPFFKFKNSIYFRFKIEKKR